MYYARLETALKGDDMNKKDSFNNAKTGLDSVGKAAHFKNAMQKCNLAARLTEAGIEQTAFDSSRWN